MKLNERDIFGLRVAMSAHKDIRRIKRQHGSTSLHGNKYWKASTLLIDYMREFPITAGARVLELGCGWGLSGIYCAKFFNANVTSLDADEAVFPYVEYHAALNNVGLSLVRSPYESLTMGYLSQYDVIIGADICFWDNMSDLLIAVLRKSIKAGCQRMIFSDPGRPPFRIVSQLAEEKFGASTVDWCVSHPHNTSGIIMNWET